VNNPLVSPYFLERKVALKRVPLDSHDPESYHGIHHHGVCPFFLLFGGLLARIFLEYVRRFVGVFFFAIRVMF